MTQPRQESRPKIGNPTIWSRLRTPNVNTFDEFHVVPVRRTRPLLWLWNWERAADIRASELPWEEARLSKSFFWESSWWGLERSHVMWGRFGKITDQLKREIRPGRALENRSTFKEPKQWFRLVLSILTLYIYIYIYTYIYIYCCNVYKAPIKLMDNHPGTWTKFD